MHDGKGTFSLFLKVFHRFQPYERMRNHAFAGRNTQQLSVLEYVLKFNKI